MRLIPSLALIALAAATPAAAQNEAIDPAANTAVNVTDTNMAAAPAANPANVAVDTAPMPAEADPAAMDATTTTDDAGDDRERGFPWGVLGLIGLVGLLGRRRNS